MLLQEQSVDERKEKKEEGEEEEEESADGDGVGCNLQIQELEPCWNAVELSGRVKGTLRLSCL